MTENDDVSGKPEDVETPVESATVPSTPPAQPGPPAREPVLKTRWRDRAWTFRSMVAVALASLVIGGVAGGVIGATADHGDRHDRMERMGRMGPWGPGHGPGWRRDRGFDGGGPGWRGNGPQAPGMTPYGVPAPATPPNPTAPAPSPGSTS
jgi:hypothetical protein